MALEPTYIIEEKSSILHTDREIVCSILFGKNYISYVFSNIEMNAIYMVKHFDLLSNVLGKSDFDEILFDLFIKKAKSIRIAIDSQKIMLVPSKFCDEHITTLFETMYDVYEEEDIYNGRINEETKTFYALKKHTINFLKQRMNNVEIIDASTPLLQAYNYQQVHGKIYSIFVGVKEEHVYLTVYKNKKLQLHNSFAYNCSEDVLYHISNVIKQQDIDISILGIQIHGEMKSTNDVFDLLKNYFDHVRYITRIKSLNYPEDLFNYPSHYFYNLFSLVTCEL